MNDYRGPSGDGGEQHPTARTSAPQTHTVPTWRTVTGQEAKSLSRKAWTVRRVVGLVFGLSFLFAIALGGVIVAYTWVNPPTTTTILAQRLGGQQIAQTWVPLARISPNLIRAVIMSEDAGFCRHRGVDWRELAEAVETARDGSARGGSTIAMQAIKNLFLWPSKSYLRKALEIPLTLAADPIWGKPRMLEIYLNIVEWGPGIFGAEAAAQYHFKKPASRLTEQDSALLAAALPNPVARDAGDPSALQQKLAQNLIPRVRNAGAARFACLGIGEGRGT